MALTPDELLKRLPEIPDEPPKSKLEPYREIVFSWKKQGRSNKRIAELLKEYSGLTVSPNRVNQFFKNRSTLERTNQPQQTQAEPAIKPPARQTEIASVRARFETPKPAATDEGVWEFDPDKAIEADQEREKEESR